MHKNATIDDTVEIGPHCMVDEHVTIGAGCRLLHHVYITGWTKIGENNTLHPGVILGAEPQDLKYDGARSYCRVGSHNIFREYVTIHRGNAAETETRIGDHNYLMANSHVGHNSVLGSHIIMANACLLAGHVTIGDRVNMGGMAGIHQFCRVGELCMLSAMGKLVMDVVPFAITDMQGRIAGPNRVGLRRAGLTREEVKEIRKGYRILFSSKRTFSEGVAALAEEGVITTSAGKRLLGFVRAESRRGFSGSSRS